MGGNILIMGASSHPTSEEPLTYENTPETLYTFTEKTINLLKSFIK
jgi:hypothetical protein